MRSKAYNKDSRTLSKYVKKESIDFVVTSPPYWNLRNYGYDEQIGFKQTYEEYLSDMKKVFTECYKILKQGRYIAINVGTVVSNEGMKFLCGDFLRICEEIGFTFRKDIIWHKPRGTTKWQRGATQFSQNPYPLMFNTNINHEFILIFQKGDREQFDYTDNARFSKGYVRKMAYSVWDIVPITSPKLDEKHVAPFPEEIPKRLIQLFTFKGDTVLDPFAGCGTTCKVSKELGRSSIGFELSKDYCNLIKSKVSTVKFDSLNDDEYDNGEDSIIIYAKEKLDKASKDFITAKKNYEKLLKKSNLDKLVNFR